MPPAVLKALMVALALSLIKPVFGQQGTFVVPYTGTLKKVNESGVLRLGSREIVAIYEKWFQKPLPSGVRLNLPMSPHLEELFRVQGLPTD